VQELAELIGKRLKQARSARGLSVGALAATAGIGKGSLSEIENGTRNPTLSTLYVLANSLQLPLATLLDMRAGARISSPGIEARLLDASTTGDATVEVYRLSLSPGVERRSASHGVGVVEHLLVTSGRALVGRVGEQREIGPGESAQWTSDTEHTYLALPPDPVEAVLIIRSPRRSRHHRSLESGLESAARVRRSDL
jgi:transcriptional regulator with XRE-family HTH domain